MRGGQRGRHGATRFALVDYDAVVSAKKAAKADNVRIDGRVVRIEFASEEQSQRGQGDAPAAGGAKGKRAQAGAGRSAGPRQGSAAPGGKPKTAAADEERRARAAFGDDDDDDDGGGHGGQTYEDRTSGKGGAGPTKGRKAAKRSGAAADPFQGVATFNTESSSASALTRPIRRAPASKPAGPVAKKTKFNDDDDDNE